MQDILTSFIDGKEYVQKSQIFYTILLMKTETMIN